MTGSRHSQDNPFDNPAKPLTDEQAKAQVVDPAKEIARAVPLPDVSGGFGFGSCNDQGDPPFQGVVEVTFKLPDGVPPDDYLRQVSDVMLRLGWRQGAPAGQKVFGGLNRNGVTATVGVHPFQRDRGQIQLYGECRDMEHKVVAGKSTDVDITDQLRAG